MTMTKEQRRKLCDEVAATNKAVAERQQEELTRKTSEAVFSCVPVVTVDLRHVPNEAAFRRFLAVNSTTDFGRHLFELQRLERDGLCRVVILTPAIPPEAYADEVEAEMKRGEEARARRKTSNERE